MASVLPDVGGCPVIGGNSAPRLFVAGKRCGAQVNDIEFPALRHQIRNDAAVTIGVILFKAKQACNGFGGSCYRFRQSLLRRGGLHMRGEYSAEI